MKFKFKNEYLHLLTPQTSKLISSGEKKGSLRQECLNVPQLELAEVILSPLRLYSWKHSDLSFHILNYDFIVRNSFPLECNTRMNFTLLTD